MQRQARLPENFDQIAQFTPKLEFGSRTPPPPPIDNKHSTQQECIPVGCVPPAFYRTGVLCSGRGLCITLAQTSLAGGNYIYNVTHKDTQNVLKHILVLEFLEIW